MQLKEFNILLDIKKHNKIDYIEVVAGDSFSNVLNISLIDGIYPYDLTNTSVEIVFSKPDGTTVQQTDIGIINSAQGRIQCILKTNTIAVPGKVVAEVRILEGETLLTSTRFEFYVRKSLINDETVESSNEFGTLQEVILDYNDAIERVNQIEKQVPEQVVTDLNEVSTRVGPLSSLITRIKTSIVNALNGLQTDFNEHKAEITSEQIAVSRDLSIIGEQVIMTTKKPKSVDIIACIHGLEAFSIGNVSANAQNSIIRGKSGGFTTVTGFGVALADTITPSVYTRGLVTIEGNSLKITWSHQGAGVSGTGLLRIKVNYHGE